jgi:hypothetical protein
MTTIQVNQRSKEDNVLVITWQFTTKEAAENFIKDVNDSWDFDAERFYLEIDQKGL